MACYSTIHAAMANAPTTTIAAIAATSFGIAGKASSDSATITRNSTVPTPPTTKSGPATACVGPTQHTLQTQSVSGIHVAG